MKILKKLTGKMGAGGGAAVLAFASALSYLFGMVRDLMVAHFFGATNQTDAYATAFLLPDFIFNLFIAGSLTGVLMTVFVDTKHSSAEKAEDLFGAFFAIMNLFIVAISIGAFFAAPWIISAIFQNADIEQQKLIISMTRILLISPVFFGLSNSLASVLLAKKHFFSVAVAPIFYNIGILLGIYFFAEKYGIHAAAWGTAFGCFLHFLTRVFDFYSTKYPLKPSLNIKNKNFQHVLILAIPKTIGLLAFQGMLWGFNYLGYFLQEGSIAAFNYARNIQSFSVSLFGIALATAVFPFLAEFAAKKSNGEFINRLEKSARQILFLALPASVGLFLVSKEVVEVIFAHGEFDQNATLLTTTVLSFIAISIPFESTTHLFSRAFMARKNTVIPMISQILFLAFSVGGAALMYKEKGVMSFGISFSMGAMIQCLFLIGIFHYSQLNFPFLAFLQKLLPTIILTIIMGVVVIMCLHVLQQFDDFARLGAAVFSGTVIFFCGAFMLEMSEVERVSSVLKAKFLSQHENKK